MTNIKFKLISLTFHHYPLKTIATFAAILELMIKNILIVGTGGALGSIARYLIACLFTHLAICSELAIFLVNIIGSFIIGLLIPSAQSTLYLLMAVGFCGGFTTFSTFSVQAFQMLQSGQRLTSLIYILASVLISIAFVFIGIYLSEEYIK
jgi:CrcB protein